MPLESFNGLPYRIRKGDAMPPKTPKNREFRKVSRGILSNDRWPVSVRFSIILVVSGILWTVILAAGLSIYHLALEPTKVPSGNSKLSDNTLSSGPIRPGKPMIGVVNSKNRTVQLQLTSTLT